MARERIGYKNIVGVCRHIVQGDTMKLPYDFGAEGTLEDMFTAFWCKIFIESGVSVAEAKKIVAFLLTKTKVCAERHNVSLYALFSFYCSRYKSDVRYRDSAIYHYAVSQAMSRDVVLRCIQHLVNDIDFSFFEAQRNGVGVLGLPEFANMLQRVMFDMLYRLYSASVTERRLRAVINRYADNYFFVINDMLSVGIYIRGTHISVDRTTALNGVLLKLYTVYSMYAVGYEDDEFMYLKRPVKTVRGLDDIFKFRSVSTEEVSYGAYFNQWLVEGLNEKLDFYCGIGCE